MCQKLKTLGKNAYGELYFCCTCNMYHLLFQNFHFTLNQKQMRLLKEHIKATDVNYWDEKFCGTFVKRKIPIATYQDNLILIFDKLEFNALKILLFYQKNDAHIKILSIDEIEYKYVLN